jgi:hypothetical protein
MSSNKIGPGNRWNEEPRKDGKTPWRGPECKIGIKNPGRRQHLRLNREFSKTLKKIEGLEIGKRASGISSGFRTIKDWALWRGRPKKRLKIHSHV